MFIRPGCAATVGDRRGRCITLPQGKVSRSSSRRAACAVWKSAPDQEWSRWRGAVWAYRCEPATLAATYSGDRANHIEVYGSPTNQSAFADQWDFADVNSVGRGASRWPWTASPRRAHWRGLAVRATLQPNPALELLDVVQFNDGTGTCRPESRSCT